MNFSWASGFGGVTAPVYFENAYQCMMAKHDGSQVRLLEFRPRDSPPSYLPMLTRNLGSRYAEAYSAYGYGGVLGNLNLQHHDVDGLRRFLAAESIVALFVRHSPFLVNQNVWPSDLIELNRYTYASTLRPENSFETFIQHIPQKLRWSVNYARRAGIQATFYPLSECRLDLISAFYALYSGLMDQKNSPDYYHFSEAFFVEHAHSLRDCCEFAAIYDQENAKLLAGVFFLLDESGWVHYHLSAALQSVMKLQGMELLLLSAMHRYGNAGYRAMHLGGGHNLDESDGLSRFKSKFSQERREFFCTKLVCDTEKYELERTRIPLKNPSYFLISDARGQ